MNLDSFFRGLAPVCQSERVILPASKAKRLVEIIVLARFWLYVRVDLDTNDIGVLVVGYRGDTTLECLFAQSNVEIAIDNSNNPQETVKAPNGNERPQIRIIFSIEYGCVAVISRD